MCGWWSPQSTRSSLANILRSASWVAYIFLRQYSCPVLRSRTLSTCTNASFFRKDLHSSSSTSNCSKRRSLNSGLGMAMPNMCARKLQLQRSAPNRMKERKLRITISLSSINYSSTLSVDEVVNYKFLQQKAETIFAEMGATLSDKTKYVMFYQTKQGQEHRVAEADVFSETDLQIVVRLENDCKLMARDIQSLRRSFQTLANRLCLDDPDPQRLNSLPALGSEVSCEDPDPVLYVFLSNPLVGADRKRLDRTPLYVQDVELGLRRLPQPILAEISIATKSAIRQCKRNNPRVLQIFCDARVHPGKEAEFLLQSEDTLGLEEAVSFDELMSDPERPSLLVLVGKDVSLLAEQAARKGTYDCLAINSTVFAQDELANAFLTLFYGQLFGGGNSLEAIFTESEKRLENYFVQKLNKKLKLHELCCCYHPHEDSCQWRRLAAKVGKEAAHLECHQPHGVCARIDCPSNCRSSRIMLPQLCPALSQSSELRPPSSCGTLCCCHGADRSSHHAFGRKFWLVDRRAWKGGRVGSAEATIRVPCVDSRCSFVLEEEYLVGRNEELFVLVDFLQEEGVAQLCLRPPASPDSRNSELLLRLTRNAAAYLIDRQQRLEFVEINLEGGTTAQDFHFKLQAKLEFTRKLEPLLARLGSKKLALLLYNVGNQGLQSLVEVLSAFKAAFQQQLERTAQQSGLRVIVVTPVRMVDSQWLALKSLPVACAADSFLRRLAAKEKSLKDVSFLPYIHKTVDGVLGAFESAKAELNEEWLDRLAANAVEKKNSKVGLGQLIRLVTKEPARSQELDRLLLFVAQFADGLSEHDLRMLARTESFQQSVPENWRQLLEEQTKQSLVPGKYAYFDVLTRPNCQFLQIKARGDKLQFREIAGASLHALQYLSTYANIVLQYFQSRREYHEDLFEYSNATRSGFFFYEKSLSFRLFFDEGDHLPNVENLGGSEKGKVVRAFEKDIVSMGELLLEGLTLDKAIQQHKDNFVKVFGLRDRVAAAPAAEAKYYQHYFQHLLLNIPTLLMMTAGDTELIESYLQEGLKCAQAISGSSKTAGLLLLKLYSMLLGFVARNKTPLQYARALDRYGGEMETVLQRWGGSEQEELRFVNGLEEHLRLLRLQTDGTRPPDDPDLFLGQLSDLLSDLRRCKVSPANRSLIRARTILFAAETFRQISPDHQCEIEACLSTTQLEAELEDAAYQFKESKRVLLEFRAVLSIFALRVKQLQGLPNDADFRDRCFKAKAELRKIRSSFTDHSMRIYDSRALGFCDELALALDSLMWRLTGDLFVFMKSDPYFVGAESVKVRGHNFKHKVMGVLSQQNRKAAVIFRTLTKENLSLILANGCLLLLLKVDCYVSATEPDHISLMLGDETVAFFVPLGEVLGLIYESKVDTLAVYGNESARLISHIAQKAKGRRHPTLIAMEPCGSPVHDVAEEFLSDFRQQQVPTAFLKSYYAQLIQNPSGRHSPAFLERCFKFVGDLKLPVTWKYLAANRNPEVMRPLLDGGDVVEASREMTAPNNLRFGSALVGREDVLASLFNSLKKAHSKKEALPTPLLGLFGEKGLGKKAVFSRVAQCLALRNAYEDGVFLFDCEAANQMMGALTVSMEEEGRRVPKLLRFICEREPLIQHKLREDRPLKMAIFLCNANRLPGLYYEEFIRVAESRRITVAVTGSSPKLLRPKYKEELTPLNYREAAKLYLSQENPEFLSSATKETLASKLRQSLRYSTSYSPSAVLDCRDNKSVTAIDPTAELQGTHIPILLANGRSYGEKQLRRA